jgi:Na+/H+ antiporter NhaD/arsenite permease-like protein
VLLAGYYIVDSIIFHYHEQIGIRPASHYNDEEGFTVNIRGAKNFIMLIAIVLSVALINPSTMPSMAAEDAPLWLKFLREEVLVVIAVISWLVTKSKVREDNHFSWEPIAEVAIIFIGIFVTMTPALLYLNQHAQSLGLTNVWQFYYATGALSSFLDNAPTAVAFHTVAQGIAEDGALVAGVNPQILRAIASGAVYFGAMTYIGNGPNFMVKSIAEKEGVKMPSFFAYIAITMVVLLPVYIAVQLMLL